MANVGQSHGEDQRRSRSISPATGRKLATQTAGGTAPDIIQMDMASLSASTAHRGALLDLSKVDVSSFVQARGSGKIDDKLAPESMPASTV